MLGELEREKKGEEEIGVGFRLFFFFSVVVIAPPGLAAFRSCVACGIN